MNRPENLERDLTAWFVETATPRVPDFTDDILRLTAGTRQRPRWSFPERWLPMSVITLGRRTLEPLPWRTIGLLAALALLIAASIAFYVGSQQTSPDAVRSRRQRPRRVREWRRHLHRRSRHGHRGSDRRGAGERSSSALLA